jgi:hypothetical protein
MTEPKQSEPTARDALLTGVNAPSSDALRMGHSTIFWLARIKPEDIARSWIELMDAAKDARHRITLGASGNGTTIKGVYLEGATVCITRDGSVVIFTAASTSASSGAEQP